MPTDDRPASEPAAQTPPGLEAAGQPAPPLVIDSRSLFQGSQELLIQHGEQVYRLRQTRNGKLILNK